MYWKQSALNRFLTWQATVEWRDAAILIVIKLGAPMHMRDTSTLLDEMRPEQLSHMASNCQRRQQRDKLLVKVGNSTDNPGSGSHGQ